MMMSDAHAFKFCCQYGVECYKVHTDEENQFFEENDTEDQ